MVFRDFSLSEIAFLLVPGAAQQLPAFLGFFLKSTSNSINMTQMLDLDYDLMVIKILLKCVL